MKRKRNFIKEFKRKWRNIEAFEQKELRKLTIREKLHQLASLINLGRGLGLDFNEDGEKLKVRSRWARLKRNAQ